MFLVAGGSPKTVDHGGSGIEDRPCAGAAARVDLEFEGMVAGGGDEPVEVERDRDVAVMPDGLVHGFPAVVVGGPGEEVLGGFLPAPDSRRGVLVAREQRLDVGHPEGGFNLGEEQFAGECGSAVLAAPGAERMGVVGELDDAARADRLIVVEGQDFGDGERRPGQTGRGGEAEVDDVTAREFADMGGGARRRLVAAGEGPETVPKAIGRAPLRAGWAALLCPQPGEDVGPGRGGRGDAGLAHAPFKVCTGVLVVELAGCLGAVFVALFPLFDIAERLRGAVDGVGGAVGG